VTCTGSTRRVLTGSAGVIARFPEFAAHVGAMSAGRLVGRHQGNIQGGDPERNVAAAGRIMSLRRMGKASFFHLEDSQDRIQVYLKRDDLGEIYDSFNLMDISDIVGIEGSVFRTRTGEVSVHARKLVLLAKSVRPRPVPKEKVDEEGNRTLFAPFPTRSFTTGRGRTACPLGYQSYSLCDQTISTKNHADVTIFSCNTNTCQMAYAIPPENCDRGQSEPIQTHHDVPAADSTFENPTFSW
jgi:hypothetical protein